MPAAGEPAALDPATAGSAAFDPAAAGPAEFEPAPAGPAEFEPAAIAGLVLAAGSGRRYGRPKALVDTGDGPWVNRAVDVLVGCEPRLVVVGASGDEVARLLPAGVDFVDNPEYAEGMGSSLRIGLLALATMLFNDGKPYGPEIDAALVMLVDLPGVTPAVIRRVCSVAGPPEAARGVLARASFNGLPGHPVLLGRRHWGGVIESALGDVGARDYFAAHPPITVECGDIGSGEDIDSGEHR